MNGINSRVLRVFHNMYAQAKSYVSMDGQNNSSNLDCHFGVRQGENLAPVLYALFWPTNMKALGN